MKQDKESILRYDAFAKVTGKAKYIDDLYFPDMYYVQTVRVNSPRAEIISIDPNEALLSPGVKEVLTANIFPDVPEGERPVLAKKSTAFAGDGVALVIADSMINAKNGAKKVKVKYKNLPFNTNYKAALETDTPVLHGDSNLLGFHETQKGDVKKGFEDADFIIEKTFETPRASHSAIEPDGAIAVPEGDGVILYVPGKAPFDIKREVAGYLGLKDNLVRVIQPFQGGVFGGKATDSSVIGARVAAAAMHTGHPCKMVWSREEVLIEGTKRHPFYLHYKVGAKNSGEITSMEIQGIADAGAYATKSMGTVWRATVEATGPYKIPNVYTHIDCVYTNNPISDAVRGFGSPQVDFCSESMINEVALRTGMNPFDWRMKFGFDEGDITATGQKLENVNLKACLKKLAEHFPVRDNKQEIRGNELIGRGISCIYRGEAMGAGFKDRDGATVQINVEHDGTINVLTGVSEQGQGTTNVVKQVISETLDLRLDDIKISPLDTAYVPDSGATVGSRGTITSGSAAYLASKNLIKKMSEILSTLWDVPASSINYSEKSFSTADLSKRMSFENAVKQCFRKVQSLSASGSWAFPEVNWDFSRKCGDTYGSFTYAACGAEVAVNLIDGKIKILRFVSVNDAGKIINFEESKGQITGGASMGIGLALFEDILIDQEGFPMATNFDRYMIPTCLDMPNEIQAIPIEAKPGKNPIGVRGLGEPATAAIPAAIGNAVSSALGVRVTSLPLTLEKIMEITKNIRIS